MSPLAILLGTGPGLVLPLTARAAEPPAYPCPDKAPSCKIITLTPEEERALVGPNLIFDTAQQGRPLDLMQAIAYFRQKILTAPAGTVEVPKAEPPPKP